MLRAGLLDTRWVSEPGTLVGGLEEVGDLVLDDRPLFLLGQLAPGSVGGTDTDGCRLGRAGGRHGVGRDRLGVGQG